jgi:hypothetical protein
VIVGQVHSRNAGALEALRQPWVYTVAVALSGYAWGRGKRCFQIGNHKSRVSKQGEDARERIIRSICRDALRGSFAKHDITKKERVITWYSCKSFRELVREKYVGVSGNRLR